jgi:DNA-3-methyladenine glycosylase
MFGPPGVAYVYLVYGMYDCLNVVADAGGPGAVLIRAVMPLHGAATMRADRVARATARRTTTIDVERERARLARLPEHRLASGPGLVAAAFSIDRTMSGADLCDPASPIRLEAPVDGTRARIVAGPRVGIAYAGEPWTSVPWRLTLEGEPAVSRPRPAG